MLSCPFCQFENAETNRLCDQCGQPLQTWCALYIPRTEQASLDWPIDYLDAEHRYRFIEPEPNGDLDADNPRSSAVMRRVIDCQPMATSPIHELQTAWLENPDLSATEITPDSPLPAAAVPYLALQADFFPSVPELHHVIQTQSYIILLIEDRTQWQSFLEVWLDPDLNPLQRIQWLFELTLLWEALAPWNAQGTLLNPDYFKLDDHNLLCLKQLDVSHTRQPLTLQHLGKCLQHHFIKPQIADLAELNHLINDLVEGKLTQLTQLKENLAKLADHEHRPISPDASPPSHSLAVNGDSLLLEPDHPLDIDDEVDFGDADLDDSTSGLLDLPTMVLPMQLAQLDEAGISHVGQQRNHNEDYFFAQIRINKVDDLEGSSLDAKGLLILCDGMGGHASGEIASQLAVATLRGFFEQHWQYDGLPDETTLKQAVIAANQAIFEINQANESSGSGRMGTTLVMLLICNLTAVVVHVGDSRLYGYTKRFGLQQITTDHEVGQREINRGVEPAIAYARPDAYQLTQALGPRRSKDLRPGITFLEIAEDTLFLLCSDGLSDHQLLERNADDYIAPLLSSKANLEDGTTRLVDLANEQNGHDNITAVVARFKLKPNMRNMPR